MTEDNERPFDTRAGTVALLALQLRMGERGLLRVKEEDSTA